MRAPRQVGDKVVISSVGDASPIAYPLAAIPQNVSYETVSDQPEVQPNQPLFWPLSFHGGYGDSHYDPRSAGVIQGGRLLTHEPNIIRAPLAPTAVTLTNAVNPPMYFFEATVNDSGADDGQPVLYAIAVESGEVNVYKISLDSGDFGTLLNTKTFTVTSTQPMGKPAEWNNGSATEWYLGLGDNGKINKLTSIVSGTSADTWSAGTNTADARHLMVLGNRLMRSTDENQVSLLPRAGDPTDESAWGSDFFVGDVSRLITELGEAGGLGYIAKQNGFFEWDTVGQAVNILPEIGRGVRNGQGMVYWHGGFLIPSNNLWWTRTGKPIGPDSNPNYSGNEPSLGGPTSANFIKQGQWMGLVPFGEYIYGLYKCGQVDNTQLYILWGRERDRNDPPGWGPLIWHSIALTQGDFDDFHGITITETSEFSSTEVRPCVWYADGVNLRYIFLNKDGTPLNIRGEIDVITGGGSVVSGKFDFGFPRVTKQLWKIDGWSEDSSVGDYSFRFRVYRDGGSVETVGATITTDGYFERFWTQDTNDTARMMLVEVLWSGTQNLTGLNGPHLRDVMVRAFAVPDVAQVWTFLFGVEDDTAKTAKKLRSELEGYRSDMKKYKLPGGDTFSGVMERTRLLRADEIRDLVPANQKPPKYVIGATVREVASS